MMKITAGLIVTMVASLALSSCANTIRGAGKDASNTVNATKNAAKDVAN